MLDNSGSSETRFVACLLKGGLCVALTISTLMASAQNLGNGIHVGQAKVYDSRQLTIMLDNLSRSLQGTSFINQGALANALGNVQGYQNTDTSTALFLNGAVGPQAAAVFANNLPAGSSAASAGQTTGTSSGPSFTINVNPPASSTTGTTGSTTTASTASASPTGYGPSAPMLPTLQTPPAYTPSFGPSGGDLLNDEVNLTYQIFNLSMLLNRSLTDRIYQDHSRLQAVVGFDIDIEPDSHAQGAVAVVEIIVSMNTCPGEKDTSPCDEKGKPEIVAMMPEQGSHNAATLTQKANSFGGALAAQVFSVGLSAQRRSQTFYLYRDIDTLSFQEPDPNGTSPQLSFGWQFRPVLGRPTVEAGLRHMMAVLSLPANDIGNGAPTLSIQVKTHWEPYDKHARTTTSHPVFCWDKCIHERRTEYTHLPPLEVPRTLTYQKDLGPTIKAVKWLPTDNATGVAMVTGTNFFPGTTVRLGNKTYTGNNDGLTLKSDDELEITAPFTATLVGGAVSGRYGEARALKNEDSRKYASRIDLRGVKVYPEGPDDVQLTAKLIFFPPYTGGKPVVACQYDEKSAKWLPIAVDETGKPVHLTDFPEFDPVTFDKDINHPGLLLNGVPTATSPRLVWNAIGLQQCNQEAPPGSRFAQLESIVPAKDVKGSTVVSVVFPFEDFGGLRSGISYDPALTITRLGSDDTAKLIITSTNPGDDLCDRNWFVQLDRCEIPITPGCSVHSACKAPPPPAAAKGEKKVKGVAAAPPPIQPLLRCMDATRGSKLDLDISATQLKSYKQLLLVHREPQNGSDCSVESSNIDDTRLGSIPDAKPKPPAPTITKGPTPASVQQYSSQTIEIDGTNLDQIKTVLFDKTQLKIVNQDAGSLIISIPPSMTQKPANHDQIQLISDQNDPVLINLDITANPSAAKKDK